ncbi:MAG: hypothetical protein PSV35_01155 [bacterium]|nr:hypothetical protein [bacterium]
MLKHYIQTLSTIFLYLMSVSSFGEDTIKIIVKTDERAAAAIGYSVGGKALGGLGKTYVGKGPKNQQYAFGYRKDLFRGIDVSCGVLTLNDNAKVVLITKGKVCRSVIIQ